MLTQRCKRLRLPGIGCGTYTKKLPKARRQILERQSAGVGSGGPICMCSEEVLSSLPLHKPCHKLDINVETVVFLGAIGVCEAKYSDLKISKRFPYDPDNPNTDLFQEVPHGCACSQGSVPTHSLTRLNVLTPFRRSSKTTLVW